MPVSELKIDPNVVIATHSWVVNTFNPAYFSPGGMTGQVLKKTSNLDGEFEWRRASTAEIFVNTIEEEQTLATNQTIVDFTTVSTMMLRSISMVIGLPIKSVQMVGKQHLQQASL